MFKLEIVTPRPETFRSDGAIVYQVIVDNSTEMEFWFLAGAPFLVVMEIATALISVRNRRFKEYSSGKQDIPLEADLTKCWASGCGAMIDRNRTEPDGGYGNFCPFCGKSLRLHPFFGEGTEYDRRNSAAFDEWARLNSTEKNEVRKKYGFF